MPHTGLPFPSGMSGDSSLDCSASPIRRGARTDAGSSLHARCCEDAHCRLGVHRAQPKFAAIQARPEAALSIRPLSALLPPAGALLLVPLSLSLPLESWCRSYGCWAQLKHAREVSQPWPGRRQVCVLAIGTWVPRVHCRCSSSTTVFSFDCRWAPGRLSEQKRTQPLFARRKEERP